jgi:hypothetical protein
MRYVFKIKKKSWSQNSDKVVPDMRISCDADPKKKSVKVWKQ